ncbi:MAG: PhzF family phenazine biosynthesis protein [Cellvibrionales bacterium]|nr:PhzF family phenazine biosynthesis protein [Cellvibrionales bacterium]
MKKELSIYQVDAFASKPFEGNPAAVIPLNEWLPDITLQSIAEENNLSETVFFVKTNDRYHIRWFTPTVEAKMCGHATLASAFVLFTILGYGEDTIHFDSLSGPLSVSKEEGLLVLDFPAQSAHNIPVLPIFEQALGVKPQAVFQSIDTIVLFENEADILKLTPDFTRLSEIETRGIIVTAASKTYDFVSRFFAPRSGIMEDPVTGSAHTQLTPFWANRLDKTSLIAKQISRRGGTLYLTLAGDRVKMAGEAVLYLEGKITITT